MSFFHIFNCRALILHAFVFSNISTISQDKDKEVKNKRERVQIQMATLKGTVLTATQCPTHLDMSLSQQTVKLSTPFQSYRIILACNFETNG